MDTGLYEICFGDIDDINRNVITQAIKQQYNRIEITQNTPNAHLVINDDFIGASPIRIGELMDKIDIYLFENTYEDIIKYKNIILYWQKSKMKIQDNAIELTDRERDIMAELMTAKNAGCTRDYLLNKIWGYRPDIDTHTLETHIYRLRQKIEIEPDNPKLLITADKGYRLAM